MKKLLSICLVTILVISLVACSVGTNKPAETTETDKSSTTTETVPESEKLQGADLEFMIWGSTNEQAAQKASCAAFDQKYGTKTTVTWVSSDEFFPKLTARLAANDAPSLSYSSTWNFMLYEQGYLWNFNELVSKYGKQSGITADDWIDTVWYKYSPTDVLGPVFASVTNSLMYNVEMFDEAGVEYPPTDYQKAWTWDQMVEAAKKLTIDVNGNNAESPNFDPKNIKQFGIATDLNLDIIQQFIYGNGGYILSNDGKSTALNEDKTADVIQRFADLVNKHHVHPTKTQSAQFESVASAMKSKKIAMFMGGSWRQMDLAAADFKWGVGAMPMGDMEYVASFTGSTLLAYKAEEHTYAQYMLYTYLCDPQSSDEILSMYQSLWIPSLKKYYTDPDYVKVWASEDLPARPKGFQEAIVNATYNNRYTNPTLMIKNYTELQNLFTEKSAAVWTGEKTAKQAMEELNKAVEGLNVLNGTYTGERK
jgi:multiple sugar transport system substrate-binding protein